MTAIPEVPWMIENGAKHTVQIARNVAFAAFGGREGVVGSKALEVRETAVPSGDVEIYPGTFAVLNRAAGAFDEMYVGRVGSALPVAIAPTGATGRSDLIVARVENPNASGETWPAPVDPAVGPYASIAVISNVPASTTSAADLGLTEDHSMIALARIDLPASATDVTQAMIADLRGLSNNATQREFRIIAPGASESLTSGAFVDWPTEAAMTVDVPAWATHVRTRVILGGIKFGTSGGGASNVQGDLRLTLGFNSGEVATQASAYNLSNDGGKDRSTLMAGSVSNKIPEADRGQTGLTVRVEGKKDAGDTALLSDSGCMISLEVEFFSKPESNV